MGLSGHLHAQAALNPEKESWGPFSKRLRWPQKISRTFEKEKLFFLPKSRDSSF
jgi:hypothetical protein